MTATQPTSDHQVRSNVVFGGHALEASDRRGNVTGTDFVIDSGLVTTL